MNKKALLNCALIAVASCCLLTGYAQAATPSPTQGLANVTVINNEGVGLTFTATTNASAFTSQFPFTLQNGQSKTITIKLGKTEGYVFATPVNHAYKTSEYGQYFGVAPNLSKKEAAFMPYMQGSKVGFQRTNNGSYLNLTLNT